MSTPRTRPLLDLLRSVGPVLRSPSRLVPHARALLEKLRAEGPDGVREWIAKPAEPAPAMAYPAWISDRLARRRDAYPARVRSGIFSLLTSAYDTPPEFLLAAAESAFRQTWGEFEWILVDNGSSRPDTLEALARIARDPRVRLVRLEVNQGILGGMRTCLEHATGVYVIPFDSDDLLYEDALAIFAHFIEKHSPSLLYSDEDKIEGQALRDAYWKPGWDPVLFANSCYIAHLDAIDREKALALGCYTFAGAQGCHDWDSFFRFLRAGHQPQHVPEILYSWRMHPQSCSGNMSSKSYIHSSHRAVLGLHLEEKKLADCFSVEPSPFFGDAPDWWFRRRRTGPATPLVAAIVCHRAGTHVERLRRALSAPGVPIRTAVVPAHSGPATLGALAQSARTEGARLVLVSDLVTPEGDEWAWEAVGLPELYPDTGVVGGRILDGRLRVADGGSFFGFHDVLGCPDEGRARTDPGYFATALKQRSVSAVPGAFCVVDPTLLLRVLERDATKISFPFLGAWLGAEAARSSQRVVYSPYFVGLSETTRLWRSAPRRREKAAFVRAFGDLVPDTRFYSTHLGLSRANAFAPVTPDVRIRELGPVRARLRSRSP